MPLNPWGAGLLTQVKTSEVLMQVCSGFEICIPNEFPGGADLML